MPQVFSQEFKKSTFSENIVVIYDMRLYSQSGGFLMVKSAGDVQIQIGLQSTSADDFKFSDDLIKKIRDEDVIQSVSFTNIEEMDGIGNKVGCVDGVKGNNQCVLINLDFEEIKKLITDEDREQKDGKISRVQIETKKIGDSLIDDINNAFGTNAKFHSVFIHVGDKKSENGIMDKEIVSAVYISPKENSYELINRFSESLISNKITNGNGFYDIAKEFAKDETRELDLYEGQITGQTITPSTISFTIYPTEEGARYLLNVSATYYNVAKSIGEIYPLEYLNIKELKRSTYFENEFVPLDSLLDLIILTPEKEPIMIDSANTFVIEKISNVTDINKKGWFFELPYGDFTAGKFLFGKSNSVTNDELKLKIVAWDGISEVKIESSVLKKVISVQEEEGEEEQSQYVIIAVIIVVAIAAAIYYMKGYKSNN
jgi:hypothetical protein